MLCGTTLMWKLATQLGWNLTNIEADIREVHLSVVWRAIPYFLPAARNYRGGQKVGDSAPD